MRIKFDLRDADQVGAVVDEAAERGYRVVYGRWTATRRAFAVEIPDLASVYRFGLAVGRRLQAYREATP